MSESWTRLQPRITELSDLNSALRLLGWDQHVMMPAAGGPARASAVASVQAIAHSRLSSPELGELLAEAGADDSLGENERASIALLQRDHEKATKVPEPLVRELAEVEALSFQDWARARPANDFSILEPHLSKLVALKKEAADAIGWEHERYDALLDDYEPGMATTTVEALFANLVPALRPVTETILAAAGERPLFLTRTYEADKQESFCTWLVQTLGFDLAEGRFDVSPHPFTIRIGRGDVRQTTRYEPRSLLMSIRASIHETGHALYEQGVPKGMAGLPVGDIRSLGLHESQSRIWEIHVGMGRAFVEFMLPHLKDRFPEELGRLSPDEFYRGVNHPRRSLIRVQADEVTYNLHIALRFELELALFRDELTVAELPEAFEAAMEKYLGIRPEDQADGVLQDMHWAIGGFGYFPTYTLGTLYAAALYDRARADLGDVEQEFRSGDTSSLLAWLGDKIYIHGARRPGTEIAEQAIGAALGVEPFLDHLKKKYSEIYDLSF